MSTCKEWFNSVDKITEFLEDERNQEFEVVDLISILIYHRKKWCRENRCGILNPIFVFRQYFLDRRGNTLVVSYIPEGMEISIVADKEIIWHALEKLPKKGEIKFSSYCKDLPKMPNEKDLTIKFKKVKIP